MIESIAVAILAGLIVFYALLALAPIAPVGSAAGQQQGNGQVAAAIFTIILVLVVRL